MSDADAASKTEEPTPRKLEQARAKGDVVKTPDLPALASLAAVAGVIAIMGGTLARNLAVAMRPFLADAGATSLAGHGGVPLFRNAIMAVAPLLVVVLAAAAAGAAGNLVQTGLMFTPDKLKFDFAKVSPLAGFKRLFGIDAGIQFVKSLIKVFLTAALAWWVVKPHLVQLANLATLEPVAILPFAADILRRLVFSVLGLMLVIAGADWMVQRQRHAARMRMTKEEIKEDHRQSEGDPHVKARQRQIRHDRARRRMMQQVPKATVVVMNPTHYAVALRYDPDETDAPECVAKGLDSLALKIRAVAEEAGVPIVEDAPLARALYRAVEIDEMIPQAHYEAVAKIIGLIMNAGTDVGRRAAAPPL